VCQFHYLCYNGRSHTWVTLIDGRCIVGEFATDLEDRLLSSRRMEYMLPFAICSSSSEVAFTLLGTIIYSPTSPYLVERCHCPTFTLQHYSYQLEGSLLINQVLQFPLCTIYRGLKIFICCYEYFLHYILRLHLYAI